MGEMESLSNEAEWEEKTQRKECIVKKLKRLLPGATTTLAAIQTSNGDIIDTPEGMASALRDHWGTVFQHKEINRDALSSWLRSLDIYMMTPTHNWTMTYTITRT